MYRAARTALSFPAHTALENACAGCKTQWESKVMECRYTTPTGGSVPEWERKAKYPPEPRDRAHQNLGAPRAKTLARRAARCAPRFQVPADPKWAKNGPKMVQLLSHLFIFASTQPLNFRGRMGRRTSTVHRERTEKRVFGANFFL